MQPITLPPPSIRHRMDQEVQLQTPNGLSPLPSLTIEPANIVGDDLGFKFTGPYQNKHSNTTSSSLAQYLGNLHLSDTPQVVKAVQQVRILLSGEHMTGNAQQIIDSDGALTRMNELLMKEENPYLQFESAWALTNIASSTTAHTRAVVESGSIPLFISLLRSECDDVKKQSAWALGNISGDCAEFRDKVLEHGALPVLIEVGQSAPDSVHVNRQIPWTISNLCRSKPVSNFSQVQQALPLLREFVSSTDDEIRKDACWALSYLTNGPNERIQTVLQSLVVPKIIELLAVQGPVQTPAVRTIGNIATGTDAQTQYLLDLNVMPYLLQLCDHPKTAIRKETCWCISNITAGTSSQIQAVIDINLIPKLISMLPLSESSVKLEIAWAISNCTSGGTIDQCHYLAHNGALAALCSLLSDSERKPLEVSLTGIENILKAGRELNEEYACMLQKVEECGGIDLIENLENHSSNVVSSKAKNIIGAHFCNLQALRKVGWDLVTVNPEHNDCCSICLDCFDFNEQHCQLSCGHIFHENCMDTWSKRKFCCPLCRTSIKKSSKKLSPQQYSELNPSPAFPNEVLAGLTDNF